MRIPASPSSSSSTQIRSSRNRIWFATISLALVLTLGYLIWPTQENAIAPNHIPPMPEGLPVAVNAESSQVIQDLQAMQHLRRVVVEDLDGQQVLRIQVVEHGDELIVDAATGALLAVRDREGKTTWQPLRKPVVPQQVVPTSS